MKKLILMVVLLLSMVSFATAAANYDYITLPNKGIIEVQLLERPNMGETWNPANNGWDIMLYTFTDYGGVITVEDEIDLFYNDHASGDITYLTVENNIVWSKLPCGDEGKLMMYDNHNLGVAFGFDDNNGYTTWYSHADLNGGENLFTIIADPSMPGNGMIEWQSAVGYDSMTGGTINMRTLSAVPVPPSLWLLSSGLMGIMGLIRKKD